MKGEEAGGRDGVRKQTEAEDRARGGGGEKMSNVLGKGMEAYGKTDGKTHKRGGSETAANQQASW